MHPRQPGVPLSHNPGRHRDPVHRDGHQQKRLQQAALPQSDSPELPEKAAQRRLVMSNPHMPDCTSIEPLELAKSIMGLLTKGRRTATYKLATSSPEPENAIGAAHGVNGGHCVAKRLLLSDIFTSLILV